jgi:lipid-binding SYLF domain-containing protein
MDTKRVSAWVSLVALLSTASCERGARSPSQASADERSRALEKVEDASAIVSEMIRNGKIPSGERDQARCVVVVPGFVSGGFVVGASHGDGLVTCRIPQGWSTPAFVKVSGGSAGLQIGVESADVVMLIKSEQGMSQLFRSNFEMGAGTSAAAGSVGEGAHVSTDAGMRSEVIAYARSRGLFAGVEFSGAVMKPDSAAAGAVYGGSPDVRAILHGEVPPPRDVLGFLNQMRTTFPPVEG